MQEAIVNYFTKTLVGRDYKPFTKCGNSFVYTDNVDMICVQVTPTNLIIIHDGDYVVQNMSMSIIYDSTEYQNDEDFEEVFLNKYLQEVLGRF